MVLFGPCRSTVDCLTVTYILQKLSSDASTFGRMFKLLLTDWGLSWNFDDKDGICKIEGSWEAMLKGYTLFTAIDKASKHPEIYHDFGLLYQWSTDYCREVSKYGTSSSIDEDATYTHNDSKISEKEECSSPQAELVQQLPDEDRANLRKVKLIGMAK